MSKAKSAQEVKERPIIYSPWKIRRILAWDFDKGGDMQTRRVAKFKPTAKEKGLNLSASSLSVGYYCTGAPDSGWVLYSMRGGCWNQVTERLFCPYGKVGDRLWVRERWMYVGPGSGSDLPSYVEEAKATVKTPQNCWYYADYAETMNGISKDSYRWNTPLFLPRTAARITLEITGIRVERLQQISRDDIVAEGIGSAWWPTSNLCAQWQKGWDAINGKRKGCSWSDNPFCWVIEFQKLLPQ